MELRRLSLRRSAAAAPLASLLLPPPGSLSDSSAAALEARRAATATAVAAAAAAGSVSWVDVLVLEADAQQQQPDMQRHPEGADASQLAASLHYYDTNAAPSATRAASPGRRRCVLAVGRLLLAHAPGFATSLCLFASHYSAAASAGVLGDSRFRGSSGVELASAAGSPPGSPTAPAPPATGQSAAGGAPPLLLLQALQPQLELECRLSQLEVAALASQAAGAAAAVLLLRQLELRR